MRIFFKTEVFFSVLALRPHVNGVFGNRKRRFSKTLSRVDFFENAVFMFTCGRAKTEVFENDDVDDRVQSIAVRVLYLFSRWRTKTVWLFYLG